MPCSFSRRATFFGETEALRQTLPTLVGEKAGLDSNAESLPEANPAVVGVYIAAVDVIFDAPRVNHSDATRRVTFIFLF